MENKDDELFIPKTKHKGLKIFLVILLIGALIAGGYFLYKEKFDNPKETTIAIVDEIKKESENIFSLQNNDKLKINGIIKIDATLPNELKKVGQIINNIGLQFNGEIDNKNNIGNIELNTKYKNEQLLNIKSQYDKNNIYLLLDGIYDKYLKVSLDKLNENTINATIPEITIEPKDGKTLINSTLDALKKALNELEFTREKTNIAIDGTEYSVNNNYTVLKNKDINKFIKNIVTSLSNDNEFKNVLKRLTNEDSEKVFKEINESIDKQDFNKTIKLNFYTTGILKQSFISTKIEVIENDETAEFRIDRLSDDEFSFSIKATGVEVVAKLKKNEKIANLDLSANVTGIQFKIEVNTNYEKINDITKVDVSNSKEVDKLTNEEKESISEKMQNNKALQELTKDINQANLIQE